jgi:hypothetical protein
VENGDVVTGNITTSNSVGDGGPVILSAPGTIRVTGDINASALPSPARTSGGNGGAVTLSSTTGNIQVRNIDTEGAFVYNPNGSSGGAGGSVKLSTTTGGITVGDSSTPTTGNITGGSITLSSADTIRAGQIRSYGSINLSSSAGGITVGKH